MLREKNASQGGFTLVAVLWLVALLTLILVGFQRSAGTHTNLAANAVANARAEALADAGVHQAVLDLYAARAGRNAPAAISISTKSCRAGAGETIETRIEDAAGRVDLNAANEGLLAALLAGLGATAPEAAAGAAAIADYRDRDNEARPGGAEAAAYSESGLKRGPRNAPFQTAEELESVFGFSLKKARTLLPFVTVHSGMPGIDPNAVSQRLLALLSEGQRVLAPAGVTLTQTLPPEFMSASTRQSFIVTSLGQAGGARFVREAVVALGSGRTADFRFRGWKQGEMAASGSPSEAQLELCPGITGS